mmetsp:Transcript_5211/g.8065  ORF Transcript_5211/g.8065 Transcript_5211/m.8065 type:complete len:161 (-) Transcript_5211:865-1347(-)
MEAKVRAKAIRGLSVFNEEMDPFVDLDLIDFGQAYSFLTKYFAERSSDWLQVKKYYLKPKAAGSQPSPMKIKQDLKVTFNESPEIKKDDQRLKASFRAAATTHDSSKSDRISMVKNQYMSEEAKNLYNGLMIRNYKIQQEVNTYARHFRIMNQRKINRRK